MPGTKRASEGEGPKTRASKVAKTDSSSSPKGKKGGAKKGAKAPLKNKEFTDSALPLHVNLTHTPPAVHDDDKVPASNADPGFINSITLLPSGFSTGSYGWKGSRRIAVEVDKDGKKEKLQVQLTINATVLGSKNSEGEDGGEEEAAADGGEENDEE